LQIPEHLKEVAKVIPGDNSPTLSSTDIRNRIRLNQAIPESDLETSVLDYIQRHGLYKK